MARRLTYKEVKEYVESRGFDLVSDEYKNYSTKLEIRCSKHGIFKSSYGNFRVTSHGCPKCGSEIGASKQAFSIEFVKSIAKEDGFRILDGEYKNNNTKLTFVCPKGHKFKSVWSSYYNGGNRCPTCSRRKKHTIEYARSIFNEAGFELLEKKYKNVGTPMKAKCHAEGHIVYPRLGNILSGQTTCLRCYEENKSDYIPSMSDEEINEKIERYHKNKIKFVRLVENLGHHRRGKFKCRKCSFEWETTLDKIISPTKKNRTGCPSCAGNLKRSVDEVKEILLSKGIELVGRYKNGKSKTQFKCLECGKNWKTTFSSIVNSNTGCPHCKSSRGERKISKILDENKVKYSKEKSFDGCKDKVRLRFDFYIQTLDLCIEMQGLQHFQPIEFFGGKRGFKKQQKRDQIKRDFCKKEGIRLLEISYKDFDNIEKILKKNKVI